MGSHHCACWPRAPGKYRREISVILSGYLYAASHHPIKGRVVLTFSPSVVFLDH